MASETDVKRNTVEARQGSTRPKLIYVLGIGLALVLVAFLVVSLTTH